MTGRPKKFETPEEMQEAIDAYFEECDNNKREVYSKRQDTVIEIAFPLPYTIEGLADSLDVDRRTLLNYSKDDQFFPTVKKAKSKIARNKIERGLTGESVASVSIFDLKNNHGYKDQTDLNHTTNQEGWTHSDGSPV